MPNEKGSRPAIHHRRAGGGLLRATVASALVLSACTSASHASSAGDGDVVTSLTADGLRALQTLRDESIRQCMRQAGFEWTPIPPPALMMSSPHGFLGAETPDALIQFRRSEGYGVTLELKMLEQTNADWAIESKAQDYLMSLTPAAREQYDVVLHGHDGESGCERMADDGSPSRLQVMNLQYEFADQMYAVLVSEPSAAVDAAVFACLRSKGMPYESREEVEADLLRRMSRITGSVPTVEADGTVSYTLGPTETGEPFEVQYDAAALDDLRQVELTIGRAEADCWEKHRPELDAMYEPVIDRFVEEHADDLSALRDQLAKGSGE